MNATASINRNDASDPLADIQRAVARIYGEPQGITPYDVALLTSKEFDALRDCSVRFDREQQAETLIGLPIEVLKDRAAVYQRAGELQEQGKQPFYFTGFPNLYDSL